MVQVPVKEVTRVGEVVTARGAELELAARLEGESGSTGQRPGVVSQSAEPIERNVVRAVGDIVHEPLGLDADAPWWAGLETGAGHEAMDVVLGADRRALVRT